MEALLEIVGLMAVVVAVYAASRRFHLLTPIALVVVGLALSMVPGIPTFHLSPEFVLIGVLPPLLYVAALETSVPAFKFNLRPILLLSVGLVLFVACSIGLLVHALLPGVPLAICFALGAVVAPPDAIAATAVARRIGLPRRIVTILEGESLLNDATALVFFRVATAAAIGEAAGLGEIGLQVVRSAGGGVLIGAAGALIMGFLHKKTTDPLIDNSLSLLTPFLVTAAAEALHASAVVAVVVAGLYLGHRLPTLMSAASRLQMGAFWRMVQFLLEGSVFLLVGLQLRDVLGALDTPLGEVAVITTAVVLAVVITRFVWMFPATYLPRMIPRVGRNDPPPPWQVPTVIAWAGMRGVVTLATALALPATPLVGGGDYPRALFVWLAFAVIIATLLLQGMTLPLVARRLRLQPDDPMQDILAEAATQNAASRAAIERLEQHAAGAPAEVVERLRRLTTERNNTAWERLGGGEETPSQAYVRLRFEMLDAEREVYRTARDSGRIPEEVLVRAQRDMDLEESMLERSEHA
ncbi:CPA1 family monovalent cation:H+ antiporter [Allocatelliglobosispora scoriae]|uniref:CPA1 family monovalent cation:H+ antiporter n=1 Tax=Allocatelliglobosispora scoriae TaxID=643052 RepID=A0A841BKY6_9ACTN|nr:Na+/H+ antiporter [Allocatelliglobosispora scoriae]MBB5868028.1 CPA1 family monovalent cation:H+ antiporter [Allocatelliglobosispora scoriae]